MKNILKKVKYTIQSVKKEKEALTWIYGREVAFPNVDIAENYKPSAVCEDREHFPLSGCGTW